MIYTWIEVDPSVTPARETIIINDNDPCTPCERCKSVAQGVWRDKDTNINLCNPCGLKYIQKIKHEFYQKQYPNLSLLFMRPK